MGSMEVDKILNAGSDILNDVLTAVERNEYENLGSKIQDRVREATSELTGSTQGRSYGAPVREDGVYSGTVEPTNKRDGIYRTNYAENAAGSGQSRNQEGSFSSQKGSYNTHPDQTDFRSGAYSSDAYRRYSSDRRNGPDIPNSSSRARAQGSYQGNQSRAGYQKVYGSGNPSGGDQGYGQNGQGSASAKGTYGKYDYRNPERMNNLREAAARNGEDTTVYERTINRQSGPSGRGAYGQYDHRNPQNRSSQTASGAANRSQNSSGGRDFFAPTPFNSKNVSTSSGVVPMVFGSMGMAMGGIGTALYGVAGVLAALTGGVAAIGTGILVPLFGSLGLTGASGILFSGGKRKKDVIEDYYQYGKYVGNAEYFNIRDLAARLGIQEKKLRKNLQRMMKQGLLPQARLDDEQDMMLLTDKAYDQYRQAADSYKKRQEEEEKRERYFTSQDTDGVVRQLLAEGNEYLKKVRHYNDLIPDTQEMSNKLYRLENIMYRIFEQVKKKPEMAQNLRKFMEYYLPTTEKLLSAYIEVDKQPQVGDNITNTKKEIETAMDTINDAFEKLLDSLFEDLAWDVSSDISVMKTMLAQDGLTTDGMMEETP